MEIESANTQHPVPQNVMDVEFKLIGELTIRQFSYLLVFALISFAIAKSGLPVIFKYPLVPVMVLAGLGFAFLPFNDITLDKWVANYIRAVTNPRLRVWKHYPRVPYYFSLDTKKIVEEQKGGYKAVNKQRGSIDDFLNQGKATKIDFDDESDLVQKEAQFFSQLGLTTPNAKTQTTTPKGSTIILDDSTSNQQTQPNYKDLQEDEQHTKAKFTSLQQTGTKTDELKKKIQEQQKETTKEQPQTDENTEKNEPQVIVTTKDYQQHINELNLLKDQLIKDIDKNKFKIRYGEKIDVEKTKEHNNPKQNDYVVKNKEVTQKPKYILTTQKVNTSSEKTNQEKTTSKDPEVKVEKPRKPKTSIFKSLFGKIDKKEETSSNLPKAKEERIKTSVNVLAGSTEDDKENLIPETIVIVKNTDGDPIRALKSNKLGQFESTTPLDNGDYVVEAIKENYVFAPLKLSASGKPINPVKLVGTPAIT